MEENINVAEILKDKPQGTKLYDWLHNIDVELDTISTTDTETVVWCTNETNNNTTCHRCYSEFGTERGYPDGLQILLPSKEMRDWSKLAWNTGDILVNKDGNAHVIFEGFDDDTYETFNGNNYLWKNEGITMCFGEYEDELPTSDFSKANKEDAQKYIRQIEKRLGYKLNFENLKIEKPEFKDGDVLFVKCNDSAFIEIFEYSKKNGDLCDHASLDTTNQFLDISGKCIIRKDEITELRLATEEEKKQFFSALAKKGKAWDAEKKQIVDLKPKVDVLKPFDRVLVRNCKSENWRANLFGYIDKDGFYCCVWANWAYCIPYIGNESLLGTTKDVEG